MRTPSDLLTDLQRADATRPRITHYDDTTGERIELSGRVLQNWVAKAANLLRDELDVGPDAVVRLALPAHWRMLPWAFAAWALAATVTLDDEPADVVVTDDAELAGRHPGASVLVTLPALARRAAVPVPAGVIDEAADLSTHGDVFDPWDEPDAAGVALRAGGAEVTHGRIVPDAAGAPERVELRLPAEGADGPRVFLELVLTTWAAGGSVVLSRGDLSPERAEARTASESVTRVVQA